MYASGSQEKTHAVPKQDRRGLRKGPVYSRCGGGQGVAPQKKGKLTPTHVTGKLVPLLSTWRAQYERRGG